MTRLLASALFLAVPLFASGQTTSAPPATNAPPAVVGPPAPVSDVIAEGDIGSRAQATLEKYPEPQADPADTDLREQMAEYEPKIPFLVSQSEQLIAQNASIETINLLERWSDSFAARVGTKAGSTGGWSQIVQRQSNDLTALSAALKVEHKTWDDTAAALKLDPTAPPDLARQVAAVQTRLDLVQRDAQTRQKRVRDLQQRVDADSAQIKNIMASLDLARKRAISQLFLQNAPPIWSSSAPFTPGVTNPLTLPRQWLGLKASWSAEPGRFLAQGVLLVFLVIVFWWLRGTARRLAKEEPGIAPAAVIFDAPTSMALLLAIGATPLVYYPLAPILLTAVLGAVALIPCVILLRRLIEPRLLPILYALVAFYFLEQFRTVAALPALSARTFLLAEILGAVSFLGWLLLKRRGNGTTGGFSRAVELGARVAMGFLSAGWLAEILGFTLMSNLICVAVQRSATLAMALYAGTRIIEGLLFISMRLRPLSNLGMVRLHGSEILHRLQRLLVVVAVLTWLVTVLDTFPWAADLNNRIFAFFAHYDSHGSLALDVPGKLALALLIGWGVFQVSRLVRFILETDFFPHLRLAAGIPYAISNLIHYVMLTIAFIAATAVLGIDMTKFTILVSALGVGVGFGLQNIINNFVSGLILLFERPVKIGDTILTGTDTGTVERIGIRASVLRTPAGTEVIVPNGTLISSNVTNWTLSSRERIILIPLNVPRGPDVTHLIQILTAAAAAHPKVLKNPPPQVVAQTLGANLGLELRAWTQAVDDWTNVRSEIVLAVSAAVARENITLA